MTTETELSQELQSKAQWVADMLKADGVKAEQLSSEMIYAYMDAIGKTIARMQNTYLTNPEARIALQQQVLAELKG